MTAAERMRRYRARQRRAGLREVTKWIPIDGPRSPRLTPVPRSAVRSSDRAHSPGKDYLAMATTGCNVTLRRRISRPTLSRLLTGQEGLGPWGAHMRVFFTELPVEVVAGVARRLQCSPGHLRRLYKASGACSRAMDEYLGIAHGRA